MRYNRPTDSVYTPGLQMPPYVKSQKPDVSAGDMNAVDPNSQTMFNAEGGIIPLVYGYGRVGGKIFVVTQDQGNLIVGCVLCEGEIESIESIDINDIASTSTEYSAVTVVSYLGTTTQTAPTMLTSALAGYTDTLRYTITGTTEIASTAYCVVKMPPGVTTGFPRIAAVVKGKKVYDPRDANQVYGTRSTYKYSNNPALCIADLITNKAYGLGKTVDWTSVAATANFNDSMIGTPQEVSRQLDIVLDQQQTVEQWIEVLRGYASCFVIEENGVYYLTPDKPIGYAANFTGVSTSYGTIPYTAAQSVSSQVSFELSLKADSGISGNDVCILARGAAASEQIAWYYNTADGGHTLLFKTAAGQVTFTFTESLSTVDYKTFSISYQGSSNVDRGASILVAVNGNSLSVSGSTYGNITASTSNISLGYIATKTAFKGKMDEFRMWNRFRPLAEIQENYRKQIVTKRDPSLIIHIPFNEGYDSKSMANGQSTWTVAATAADLTGNCTGATLSPTPTYGTASSAWSQNDLQADFYRFDQTNVIADTTKFKRRGVADLPTIVEIAYTDTSAKPWREDYARVDESVANNNKRRVSNVSMPGIIRYTQAYREAVERYNNLVSDSTVMFSTWDDSLVLQVSDGIQFHHPTIEAWDAQTQTYTELFKPYRITSIREKDFGRFDIVAVEYDPQNYSTTIATAPTYADTNLPKIGDPPKPSAVTLTNTTGEILYKSAEGIWGSRIQATITPATSVTYMYTSGFLVKLYKNTGLRPLIEQVFVRANPTAPATGTVEYLSSVLNPFEDDESISYPVPYQLEVYTVSTINVLSDDLLKDASVLGKYNKPSNVTGFSGWELANKVLLSWDESIDIDVWKYDIRYYPASGGVDTASLQTAWAAAVRVDLVDALTYSAEGIPAGDWRFLICAVDSIGQLSNVPAYTDVTVTLDFDAFGLVTKKYVDWTGIGMSQWNIRGDSKPYFSTDFGDPWHLNESTLSNQTASFSVTTGALENTHSSILTFDGSVATPYISISHINAYTIGGTFSIEAYIYVNGSVASNMAIFSTRRTLATAGCWALSVGSGDGTGTAAGRLIMAGASNTIIKQSSDFHIKENTWHHVGAVVNAHATKLYVDGVEVTYTTDGGAYTYAYNSSDKFIGCSSNTSGTTFSFCGNIKRVKWYSQALSETDIAKSAEYTNNSTYSLTSMLGCWSIAEGTGTTVTDTSSNSNHGIISNGAAWTSTSYLMTEPWDYGLVTTGQWLLDIDYTNHTGNAVPYILTSSAEAGPWAYNPGTAAQTPARYIRGYIQSTGNFTVTDLPSMSLILEPKSETTPVIRTIATSGVGKLVELDNQYSTAKSILATPIGFVGTGGTPSAISVSVDRILLAPVTGLKHTGEITAAATKTAAKTVSTATRTIGTGEYIEFDLWLPPDTADLAMTAQVRVTYTSGGVVTCATTWTAGTWVSCKTAITNASVIGSISINLISGIQGIHSVVIRNLRATNGSGTDLQSFWSSGEPNANTTIATGANMENIMCGPANSFLVYAFNGANQIANDVTIKFEGS